MANKTKQKKGYGAVTDTLDRKLHCHCSMQPWFELATGYHKCYKLSPPLHVHGDGCSKKRLTPA